MNQDTIRDQVRTDYGRIARESTGCCGPECCGPTDKKPERPAEEFYGADDLAAIPREANLGLGCGNPLLAAEFETGETVLDLGSGPGLDSFLAARSVGGTGAVIGVDMTPEMISRARQAYASMERAGAATVDFRLGEIEHLPVADASVDVIISNCVINLSPEKERVFQEAFRVLKPGGRLAIADIVRTGEMPAEVREDPAQRPACVAGAESPESIFKMLRAAGFEELRLTERDSGRDLLEDGAPQPAEGYLSSALLRAKKPA